MTSTTFTPAIRRFAWKEYRTLRGLWLAVAALTIGEQWLSRLLSMAGPDLPAWLFASALFASVSTRSVQPQSSFPLSTKIKPMTSSPVSRPHGYLSSPANFSSLRRHTRPRGTPPAHGLRDRRRELAKFAGRPATSSLFGLGIFEAIAWGMLFSLCVKRPLVTALLALLVGPISIQFLVSYVIQRPSAAADPAAYDLAVPHRLALMAVVALASTILARRWLTTAVARRRPAASLPELAFGDRPLKHVDRSFASAQ